MTEQLKNLEINNEKKTLKWFEYLYLIAIYYHSFCTINASIFAYNNAKTPIFLLQFFPFLEKIMQIRNPDYSVSEKSIIYSLIIVDIIRRPIIPLSRIIKFNVLLTYLIEFSFIIVFSIWEIFITKDIVIFNNQFRSEHNIHDIFFSILWIAYLALYLYCTNVAFQKKYPKFIKPFDKIVPSLHYYLNIKQGSEKLKRRGY